MRISRHPHVRTICDFKPMFAVLGLVLLAGCDVPSLDLPAFLTPNSSDKEAEPSEAQAAEFTEKDVEAPDVFSASEAGLWDGRPSLGGVWVAHPDVKEPERVRITNQENGRFVIGALFRRERATPGPRLQLSSDAASALDVLAGAPVGLDVVALRKERIEVQPPKPIAEETEATSEPVQEISQSTLEPVSATEDAATATQAAPAASTVESTLPVSRLDKPYIQVGIFNEEANAESVSRQMEATGMASLVRSQTSNGKPFWRVLVGPAATSQDLEALRSQAAAQGFTDAFPVRN